MSEVRTRYTVDDYLALPEEFGWQIYDGMLLRDPSPTADHQRISARLQYLLTRFVDEQDLGLVLATIGCILSPDNVVEPDLLFVQRDRLDIVQKWVMGPPDLVVEILSPGNARRDRREKVAIYARFGVREVWIVDPWARTVEVLETIDGHPRRLALFTAGDVLTTRLLPTLAIDVAHIFT